MCTHEPWKTGISLKNIVIETSYLAKALIVQETNFPFQPQSGKNEATGHFFTVTQLPVWINSVEE